MNPYEAAGGAEGLRALVDTFYDHMDTDPTCAPIRRMHPDDLTDSRDKLFKFLSGWTGGPSLYIKQYGHPRLRMRHFPFPIDQDAADQWMRCMKVAADTHLEEPAHSFFIERFTQVAQHMINQ